MARMGGNQCDAISVSRSKPKRCNKAGRLVMREGQGVFLCGNHERVGVSLRLRSPDLRQEALS
jgi:hypothetical protein